VDVEKGVNQKKDDIKQGKEEQKAEKKLMVALRNIDSVTFPPTSSTTVPNVKLGYTGEQLNQIIFPRQSQQD